VKPVVQTKALKLNYHDDISYGCLRITVDRARLQIGFPQVGGCIAQSRTDFVTVDLASYQVVAS
jgi:hypothetical protein